jgi:hypothetical protein
MFMLGKNASGKTLRDIDESSIKRFERMWKGDAEIGQVDNIRKAAGYYFDRNMSRGLYDDLSIYNESLLKKKMKMGA